MAEPIGGKRWAEIRTIAGVDNDPGTYTQTVTLALRDVLAELDGLRDRLGEPREEWGISWDEMAGKDPLDYTGEISARSAADSLRATGGNGYLPTTNVRVMHRWAGKWRDADADSGCLCPHSQQPDGTLTRDGVLAVGCPVHDPDAGGGAGGG